ANAPHKRTELCQIGGVFVNEPGRSVKNLPLLSRFLPLKRDQNGLRYALQSSPRSIKDGILGIALSANPVRMYTDVHAVFVGTCQNLPFPGHICTGGTER